MTWEELVEKAKKLDFEYVETLWGPTSSYLHKTFDTFKCDFFFYMCGNISCKSIYSNHCASFMTVNTQEEQFEVIKTLCALEKKIKKMRGVIKMDLKEQMLTLCKEAGFEPTENFDKIVKAKERFGIGLRCPCDKDNPNRFCISYQCACDILKDGHCHCRCYKLKGDKE